MIETQSAGTKHLSTAAALQDEATELDFDRFALIACGHVAFQLAAAGVELGAFQALSDQPGMTLETLAQALRLQPQPARILVEGLLALRLVTKRGSGLHNARLTERLLVPHREGSAVGILGWQKHIVYPGLVDFVDALRQNQNVGLRHFPGEGHTLYQRLVGQPKLEKVFQDAMSALSAQANQELLRQAPMARYTHLLDVGGGDGTNAIAFAQRHPHLRVTVFDSPTVCALADENIAAAGLQARVKTQAGDLFVDAFPQDVDAILLSHIVTIWSAENNTRLFEKAWAALPAQGALLVFGMMGNDTGDGPISTALGSPYFLTIATGEGMLYGWDDYENWLKHAGFARVERHVGLPFDHGLIIGTRP